MTLKLRLRIIRRLSSSWYVFQIVRKASARTKEFEEVQGRKVGGGLPHELKQLDSALVGRINYTQLLGISKRFSAAKFVRVPAEGRFLFFEKEKIAWISLLLRIILILHFTTKKRLVWI